MAQNEYDGYPCEVWISYEIIRIPRPSGYHDYMSRINPKSMIFCCLKVYFRKLAEKWTG